VQISSATRYEFRAPPWVSSNRAAALTCCVLGLIDMHEGGASGPEFLAEGDPSLRRKYGSAQDDTDGVS
jgi:hypothetical protein